MATREVAQIAKELAERGRWLQVYNVVGGGSIALSDFAKMAGVKLSGEGSERRIFKVSSDKLRLEMGVSTSEQTVREFLRAHPQP